MMLMTHMKYCKINRHYKLFLSGLWMLIATTAQAVNLEDAIERAIKVDPSIRASKLNQMATEENIAIARSRLLPQISLQGSSSQLTQTTRQDIPTGGTASRSFTGPSVNHQFVIRQALIRPKELSSLRYAELQTEYTELKYKFDVAELKSRVINAWIELLGAQKIAKAYEKPLTYLQAAARQERSKFKQGDSTKDVMLEAESQYENSKATYIQAMETLKAKQSVFERLTKISAGEMLEKEFDLAPSPVISEAAKSSAWENVRDTSIELQMAQLQEMMQLERVKMAQADNKPTLDLMAAINLAQNDATSTQGYQYKNKQLGVQYSVPLYSGGGNSSAVRQATLVSESSKIETEALSFKLQMEFDNNWSQLVGAVYRQTATFQSLQSAEEQLKATKRHVELGVKTIGDQAVIESIYSRRLSDLVIITQDYLKLKFKLKYKI